MLNGTSPHGGDPTHVQQEAFPCDLQRVGGVVRAAGRGPARRGGAAPAPLAGRRGDRRRGGRGHRGRGDRRCHWRVGRGNGWSRRPSPFRCRRIPSPPPTVYVPAPARTPAASPRPAAWSTPRKRRPTTRRPRVLNTGLGLALLGTVQAGWSNEMPVGGAAGALQIRTSRHSLLSPGAAVGRRLPAVGWHPPQRPGGPAGRPGVLLERGDRALPGTGGRSGSHLAGGRWAGGPRLADFRAASASGLELRLGRHLVLDGRSPSCTACAWTTRPSP